MRHDLAALTLENQTLRQRLGMKGSNFGGAGPFFFWGSVLFVRNEWHRGPNCWDNNNYIITNNILLFFHYGATLRDVQCFLLEALKMSRRSCSNPLAQAAGSAGQQQVDTTFFPNHLRQDQNCSNWWALPMTEIQYVWYCLIDFHRFWGLEIGTESLRRRNSHSSQPSQASAPSSRRCWVESDDTVVKSPSGHGHGRTPGWIVLFYKYI